MLYDFIHEAIDKKKRQVHFGRTALEIKSTIGAKREDAQLFLFVKDRLLRMISNRYIKRLQPTKFIARSPFNGNIEN